MPGNQPRLNECVWVRSKEWPNGQIVHIDWTNKVVSVMFTLPKNSGMVMEFYEFSDLWGNWVDKPPHWHHDDW